MTDPGVRRPLQRYAAKRAFERTPEPAPATPGLRQGPLLFVIQLHAARRLHQDFRLELDGVLKSWAVPKGLTLDAQQKRLAVEVEDHPFEYGSFEGVIPQGEYGAGAVIVWDCGVYAPDEDGACWERERAERQVRAGLAAGKLDILLRGEKLKGSFVLVRTAGTGAGGSEQKQWLLIKQRDRFTREADTQVSPRSVLSGRTLEEMAAGPAPARIDAAQLAPAGPAEALPERLEPMLAQEGGELRARPGFLYEPKLDGYRVLAFVDCGPGTAGRVRLKSRGGIDLTPFFPEVATELATQVASLVADGEIVALGADGRPSFNALQKRAQPMSTTALRAAQVATPAVLVCFDLLHFAGLNLRGAPYEDRRRYLAQALLPGAHLQLMHAHEDGEALYAAALASGHEGILAKRRDSPYLAGKRSSAWLKIKAQKTAELVVGGFTQGLGERETLGALLLGYWERGGARATDARLIYAGHVGSGLSGESIAALQAQLPGLHSPRSPFATRPSLHRPTTWLRPELVVEVRFLSWTAAGLLRAPVFVRTRPDIAAMSIVKPDGAGRR
jgi:bifunctional non-homologous end joining protein LigD